MTTYTAALKILAQNEGLEAIDHGEECTRLGHPHTGPLGWYRDDSLLAAAEISDDWPELSDDEDERLEQIQARHSAVADALVAAR